MALRTPPAPAGMTGVVVQALSRLPKRGKSLAADTVETADTPLPVYSLALDALDGDDPLGRATLVGWRYLVRQNGRLAAADAREGDGTASFAQLNRGPLVEALAQAAARAEQLASEEGVDGEARILEIPALKVAAIWIHGGDDRLLRFEPRRVDAALISAPVFVSDARALQAKLPTPEALAEPAAQSAPAPVAAPARKKAPSRRSLTPAQAAEEGEAAELERARRRPARRARTPSTVQTRKLTILAQDPATRVGPMNTLAFAEVEVPAEELAFGPTGYRVKVVDYDASSECLYKDTSSYTDARGNYADPFARRPGETDADFEARLLTHPNFHAQNAYAIVMRTLARFEKALGRRVAWGFEGHQLHVVPHAFCEANAFYSKTDRALLFGYFRGASGEIVHTCLSHDVVAHETTHALLDGLRSRYSDVSLPDQAALHEGFADVVALLSMFSLESVVAAALGATASTERAGRPIRLIGAERLTERALRESILFGLAEEVGSEIDAARASALRRSVEIDPDPGLIDRPEYQEEHTRGELFSAAIMQAFLKIWLSRIAQLGTFGDDRYNLDMVVEEGAKVGEHLLTMCIRALDYCPPTDIDFAAYLAALLTADAELVPDDGRHHYRRIVRESFAAFGIKPPADACNAADGTWKQFKPTIPLSYERAHFESMLRDKEEVFRFLWDNRGSLEISERDYVEVLSVRQSQRVGPDGFVLRETVCEYVVIANIFGSETEVALGTKRPAGIDTTTRITAYGSGAVIFDQYGRVKYHIARRLHDGERQRRRLEYLYGGLVPPEPVSGRDAFANMHRLRTERQRDAERPPEAPLGPPQPAVTPAVAGAGAAGPSSLTIYSYQVGFGDCFLLQFGYADGANRNVLIDFGTTGLPDDVEAEHMTRVAEDIRDLTGGHLHAIVATHRHADHISGFATNKNGEGPGAVIEAMQVDAVLQPWTEAPDASIDGLTLGAGEKKAMGRQQLALRTMQGLAGEIVKMLDSHALDHLPPAVIEQIDFVGRDNLRNASAVERLMRIGERSQTAAHYLYHGADAGLGTLLPGVTTYVLGPPTLAQTESIRKQRSTHPDEFWLHALTGLQQDAGLGGAGGRLFPDHEIIRATRLPRETRRIAKRVNEARGDQMLSLVRALDRQMNNTSLILLFEAGGKSFLFPGDAQWENWEYALQSAYAAKLKDVDVYKIGHHGSTNATPKSLWKAFKKTGKPDKPERMTSLLSTMPGKHGKSEDTAVPHHKLMNTAEAQSDLHSTHTYAPGELRRALRFELDDGSSG